MDRAPLCAALALMHSTALGTVHDCTDASVGPCACRYELLVKLNPDNENYKLYYAQSLYKVRALGAVAGE